jgi:hypothetical protein
VLSTSSLLAVQVVEEDTEVAAVLVGIEQGLDSQ